MIKSYAKYIKDKLNDEDEDGILDEPIHFKHLKHNDEDGILDDPIHFKHGKKPALKEASKPKHADFYDWEDRNDNKHLSKQGDDDEISDKLHKGQKIMDHHLGAIEHYTHDSRKLNKSLIKNQGKVNSTVHKKVQAGLDDAIKKNPLKHKLVVHSGTSFDPRQKVGKNGVMKSHAYISTTHSKSTASEFTKPKYNSKHNIDERHIIRVDLKKGDPAIHVEKHSENPGEHETIIKRGARLKLHKTVTHEDFASGDLYHVHHMSIVK
jgi:hypothetical protein